jgi:hypothetical protein
LTDGAEAKSIIALVTLVALGRESTNARLTTWDPGSLAKLTAVVVSSNKATCSLFCGALRVLEILYLDGPALCADDDSSDLKLKLRFWTKISFDLRTDDDSH